MEDVVPFQALIDLIEPHYPKASKKGGRPLYPLATLLRMPGRIATLNSAVLPVISGLLAIPWQPASVAPL